MKTRVVGVSIVGDDPGEALAQAVVQAGGEVMDAAHATAIICAGSPPTAIQAYLRPEIRWVQLSSAGIEDWLSAGVIDDLRVWTAAKGVYGPPIAEYVLTMMLASARSLWDVVRRPGWQPRDAKLISGKTVGVIGAGGLGGATLELLAPLGVYSIAVTSRGHGVACADETLNSSGLPHLLSASDYVVLAAPETRETRKLLDEARLKSMRRGAFLINVARGTLVDTDALVHAIARGHLSGAALDVTDPEPLPDDHPLWSLPNTFVTAHCACPPALGRELLARRVTENVRRFVTGQELLGKIDLSTGY